MSIAIGKKIFCRYERLPLGTKVGFIYTYGTGTVISWDKFNATNKGKTTLEMLSEERGENIVNIAIPFVNDCDGYVGWDLLTSLIY